VPTTQQQCKLLFHSLQVGNAGGELLCADRGICWVHETVPRVASMWLVPSFGQAADAIGAIDPALGCGTADCWTGPATAGANCALAHPHRKSPAKKLTSLPSQSPSRQEGRKRYRKVAVTCYR
jgi:hypothetical protein